VNESQPFSGSVVGEEPNVAINDDEWAMEWSPSSKDEVGYGDYPTPPSSANLYPTPPNDEHLDLLVPECVPSDIRTSKSPPPREFMEFDDLSPEDQWNIHLSRRDGRSFASRSKKSLIDNTRRAKKPSAIRTRAKEFKEEKMAEMTQSPLRSTWVETDFD